MKLYTYKEIFGDLSLWKLRKDENWKLVRSRLSDYDEGSVTTEYVYESLISGQFYQFEHWTNSWEDYGSTVDDIKVIEVKPVEITVIDYDPV